MPPLMSTTTVSTWRCKCGVRVKVITQVADGSVATIMIPCPKCGDQQKVYAETIVSVIAERAQHDAV